MVFRICLSSSLPEKRKQNMKSSVFFGLKNKIEFVTKDKNVAILGGKVDAFIFKDSKLLMTITGRTQACLARGIPMIPDSRFEDLKKLISKGDPFNAVDLMKTDEAGGWLDLKNRLVENQTVPVFHNLSIIWHFDENNEQETTVYSMSKELIEACGGKVLKYTELTGSRRCPVADFIITGHKKYKKRFNKSAPFPLKRELPEKYHSLTIFMDQIVTEMVTKNLDTYFQKKYQEHYRVRIIKSCIILDKVYPNNRHEVIVFS